MESSIERTRRGYAAFADGGVVDQTNVHVFRFQDGKPIEATGHPSDAHAFDAAVGGAITLPDARRAEQAPPLTT